MPLPRELKTEVAGIERDPYQLVYPTYGGLIRVQDEILLEKGAGQGYKIYRDLLKDAHCKAVIQKRKLAVIGREWVVKEGGTRAIDKKARDMVKKHLDSLGSELPNETEAIHSIAGGFDSVCSKMLNANLYGFSPAEVLWSQDGKEVYPEQVATRSPERFRFAAGRRGYKIRLLVPEEMINGISLPTRKFLIHAVGAEDGNPYGIGLGSSLFWPIFYKRNLARFSLAYADRFGTPGLLGKYPDNRPELETKLLDAMVAFANGASISMPESASIEALNVASSGSNSLYQSLMDYYDGEMSKAVLGETGSTDQQGGGGSRARDQVGNEVRIEIAKADADLLSDTLNRTLVKWICQFNLPDAVPPKVWRRFPELDDVEDLNALAQRDSTIKGFMDLKPTRAYTMKTYNIELEEPPPPEPTVGDQLRGVFNPDDSTEESPQA